MRGQQLRQQSKHIEKRKKRMKINMALKWLYFLPTKQNIRSNSMEEIIIHSLNFELYKPSELELDLCSFYKKNGIFSPSDLTIDTVASIFNINVHFYAGPCFAEWEEDSYAFIFLNNDMSYEEQRQEFFHELCHPLRHVGIQENMPLLFQELQEAQASQFQMIAALPFYLIEQVQPSNYWPEYINSIAEAFSYPNAFVERRLNHIASKISREFQDRNQRLSRLPHPPVYEYTDGTKRLLNQLQQQVAERRQRYIGS